MTVQIPSLFETAVAAILEASTEILKIYNENHFDIDYKADESPVTLADLRSSNIICNYLNRTKIPVICEELALVDYQVRKNWEYFWLVDPLDGTKEFISHNGEFTVNIALIRGGTPILGLITIPAQGLLYWGVVGQGAYKIKLSAIEDTRYSGLMEKATRVSVRENGEEIRVAVSRSHLDNETKDFIERLKKEHLQTSSVQVGSSIKFCYIAEGKADLYLRYSPTMEWDTAAGQAIAESAGAKMVVLPSHASFHYNKEKLENPDFMVSGSVQEFTLP